MSSAGLGLWGVRNTVKLMGSGMFLFHPANYLSLREDLMEGAGAHVEHCPRVQHPCPTMSPEQGVFLDLLLCPEAAASPASVLSPQPGSNSIGLAAHPRSSSGMNIDGAAGCGGDDTH